MFLNCFKTELFNFKYVAINTMWLLIIDFKN